MTLDTFFKKFDQFAATPGAVAKMRVLVLQLAVQGNLVSQNPKDEKASILLARIGKTKELLISDRIIRRQETAPIDGTEVIFSIPQSWIWTRLGEIAEWGSGSTPSRGNSDLYDGGISWLKSGELNDNQALAESEETVTEKALTTGSFRRNKPGDVLLAMYGATIGKVAILAEPAVTNQAVCGCTPFDGVFNRYLFSYLLSQRARFHSASEGGAQPNISKVKIVAFPFPLPPLAEQKRIVAKVDELMALCDRLEAQQQERDEQASALARASLARFAEAPTPANLNLLFHKSYSISPADLRQSVLTLAIQGKLVGKDSKEEPVTTSFPTLASVAVSKDRITPKHWISVPLGKLGEWRGGGTPSKSNPDFWEGLIPWVSPKDMKVLHISDAQDHISKDAVEGSSVRMIPKGSILMVVRGMILARAFPVAATTREVTINQDMKALLPFDARAEDYLLLALRALEPQVLAMIERSTHGTCKLETKPLHALTIPIPPLAEQRRIVAKVDQLMALVDQLETKLAASRATAKSLLEALVAELTNANRP